VFSPPGTAVADLPLAEFIDMAAFYWGEPAPLAGRTRDDSPTGADE